MATITTEELFGNAITFKHKDKEIPENEVKDVLRQIESSGGINTVDRYEVNYHNDLIKKYKSGKWTPTPAERRYILKVGEETALRDFSTSKGEYQILPETAYRYTSFSGEPDDLKNPDISNKITSELLKYFHKKEGGDIKRVINRWNQGPDYYPKFKNLMKAKGFDSSFLNPFSVKEASAEEVSEGGIVTTQELFGESEKRTISTQELFGEPSNIGDSFKRYSKGVVGGIVAIPEGIGRSMEAFIPKTPDKYKNILEAAFPVLSLRNVGKWVADKSKVAREFYSPPDPKFPDLLASGLGSGIGFLIPGLGVSKAAQAASSIAPRLAGWLGAGASGTLEAMVEGGFAYDRAKQKGMEDNKASGAAAKAFWLNLPTVVFTNKLGFFADKGGAVLRAIKSAPVEAVQEWTQQVIGNFSTNDPLFSGALESAAVGGIVGGGLGAVSGAVLKPNNDFGFIPDEISSEPQSVIQTKDLKPNIAVEAVDGPSLVEPTIKGIKTDKTGLSKAVDIINKESEYTARALAGDVQTVTTVKVAGKELKLPVLEKYKGREIILDGDAVAVWNPKKETLFHVALDDSKSRGKKVFDKSNNTVESAKKYIDFVTETGEKAVFKISKKADVWNVPTGVARGPVGKTKVPTKKITAEKVQQIYQDTLTDIEFTEEGDFIVIKGYPKKELTAKEEKGLKSYESTQVWKKTPIGDIPPPPTTSLGSESGSADLPIPDLPEASRVNAVGNLVKYYLGTKEERWSSLLGKEKGRKIFEMLRFFDRAINLVKSKTAQRNKAIFKGVPKHIRQYTYEVLKGIHSIDENGIIRFGALQPAGIVSGEQFAGMQNQELPDGRIVGEEVAEGTGEFMTYRWYDTSAEYTKLVEKHPKVRKVIEKYLANEEEIETSLLGVDLPAFSRNVFKSQFDIQSRQPEGFSYLPSVKKEQRLIARIKNVFRSYTPGGRKFKTGALAESGGEETDLLKAYTTRQGEFTYEQLYNDMAGNIMALVLEPIQNRQVKPGYVQVNINHPRVAKITQMKKELFQANGIDPDKLSLYQYPAAIEEEFNIQKTQKFQNPEMQAVYESFNKAYNTAISGVTTNYLIRPSTANRNFISGLIQYNLRTLTHFYEGVMGKGFTPVAEDIKALLNAPRPSVVRSIPGETLGMPFQTDVAPLKSVFSYALAPFRAIEFYFKRASFLSDLNIQGKKMFLEKMKKGEVKKEDFRQFISDFKENYFMDIFQLMSDNADSVTFDYWNKPYILEKLAKATGKGLIPFPNYIYHKFRMYGEYSPLALRGINKSNAKNKTAKAMAGLTMWMLAWAFTDKAVKEREKELNKLGMKRIDFKFDTTGRIKFLADEKMERWLRIYDWPIIGDMLYWREIKQGGADFGDWASDALAMGPVLTVPLILMGLKNKYQRYKPTETLLGEQVSGYIPFSAYIRYARVLQDPTMRKTYSEDYSGFENFINPILDTLPGQSEKLDERISKKGFDRGEIRKYDIPSETMKLLFLNVKSIDKEEYMNYVNEQIESGKVERRIEKSAREKEERE